MENKIKCLIVDDEHLARTLLKEYASKIVELEVVDVCQNPLEAMNILRENQIDLMFSDIQMPELTGVDFIESLENPPYIIFTTAYSEYASKAFDLNVVDYLLKPISLQRFIQAVNKVINLMKIQESAIDHSNVQTPVFQKNYFTIKADFKIYKINYSDLIYVEGQREYVTFHTTKKKITALASLKKLEEVLPKPNFMRIHKSYIVSTDYIDALYGNQIEIHGISLPIGKNYKETVAEMF